MRSSPTAPVQCTPAPGNQASSGNAAHGMPARAPSRLTRSRMSAHHPLAPLWAGGTQPPRGCADTFPGQCRRNPGATRGASALVCHHIVMESIAPRHTRPPGHRTPSCDLHLGRVCLSSSHFFETPGRGLLDEMPWLWLTLLPGHTCDLPPPFFPHTRPVLLAILRFSKTRYSDRGRNTALRSSARTVHPLSPRPPSSRPWQRPAASLLAGPGCRRPQIMLQRPLHRVHNRLCLRINLDVHFVSHGLVPKHGDSAREQGCFRRWGSRSP